MTLVLTEEEQMLKSSAKELLNEISPISKLRKLRDDQDELGYDPQLWHQLAELGFLGLTIPEQYGGLDFGYTGLGQILEETGRTLSNSPLISTGLLCTTAINLGGNTEQKESLLPQIAEGSLIMAFACDEGNHHNIENYKTTISHSKDGFVLNGTKTMVLDGHIAHRLIVAAKNPDGDISLILVDKDASGISVEQTIMMDSRNAAIVKFEDVEIRSEAFLNTGISGKKLLRKTLDIACIGLSAEMLGGMQEAFERTIAYLKEREQFGVKIGTFQALQHRAANMFCEIEMCKSIVIKALKAIDENSQDLSRLAGLAKAKCGQVYKLVSNEGIQMFGGIGMTDDEEIGFFLKRARVAQQTFGDTNYHLDRLAKMKEY